jgi:hypothetical protein
LAVGARPCSVWYANGRSGDRASGEVAQHAGAVAPGRPGHDDPKTPNLNI